MFYLIEKVAKAGGKMKQCEAVVERGSVEQECNFERAPPAKDGPSGRIAG